jgi:hypothetical protein
MARRPPPRELIDAVNRLIIHRHGRKALKDADAAKLLGETAQQLYQQLNKHLWVFTRSFMFPLPNEKRSSRRQPFQSSLAFTQGGIIGIAAVLNDANAFEVAVDLARILKQRRRSKRSPRKSNDEQRAAAYAEVYVPLHEHWKKLRDKPRW